MVPSSEFMTPEALAGLRALARAVDAKDPSTWEHSERVALFVERLALAAGWSPRRSALLREAGYAHDVGKIGVPDAVLTKPGRLTPEEYEQIKTHPALGAQIAAEILTGEQVQWIRWHHERPDGKGYPDRLNHAFIPDGAKLLALADSWDVMTTTRPYKKAMLADDALAECIRQCDRQFCREAVEALLALQPPALRPPMR
jgi:HD-GYP domain-containing protein (c-di-GMP phosphodiesterase class II)